jgi:hypothetical protein
VPEGARHQGYDGEVRGVAGDRLQATISGLGTLRVTVR